MSAKSEAAIRLAEAAIAHADALRLCDGTAFESSSALAQATAEYMRARTEPDELDELRARVVVTALDHWRSLTKFNVHIIKTHEDGKRKIGTCAVCRRCDEATADGEWNRDVATDALAAAIARGAK